MRESFPSVKTNAVMSILNATKSNKAWFDEKGLWAGYHSMVVEGNVLPGQRDPVRRLARIPYDFQGKRVLDIGCSNGGVLHALADSIRFGVGVDFNARCINAANAVKAANDTNNIHFFAFDLDKEDLGLLDSFVFSQPVDVCFVLNISLWVRRWQQVVVHCARLCEVMVFEAHGSDEQQAGQVDFLRSVYAHIELVSAQSDDDPTYAKRKMYLCRDRLETVASATDVAAAGMLQRRDAVGMRDALRGHFGDLNGESLTIYPNTHESTVVEVDGRYIVKFPKEFRGSAGIEAEKRITDFIRDRVPVPVPRIELSGDPVAHARYEKIDGVMFDPAAYDKLGAGARDKLAADVAAFMRSMHAMSLAETTAAGIAFAPSWKLDLHRIETRLSASGHPAIRKLVPEILRIHRKLKVPHADLVVGHFDLHGGNLLLDPGHTTLRGVVDFGNARHGDRHQDLAALCLSSFDLCDRVTAAYERASRRPVNRLLVQHYATALFLDVLSGLEDTSKEYQRWCAEFERWYDYLLADRARTRLAKVKPLSAMPDPWRQWLASNLMRGVEPRQLQRTLRERGFGDLEVAMEMAQAMAHPGVQAGKEIFHTLQKREWLLKTLHSAASLDGRYAGAVERRAAPGYDEFLRDYYSKNLPVLLTGGADHWAARARWTPQYFADKCGDAEVEVQEDRSGDPQYERNAGQHKRRTTMREFVERVLRVDSSNDFYMTANNMKASVEGLQPLFDDLSDFGPGYRTCGNESLASFIWFGPKGTFTPLHHDLTNNMLVQIHGRKRVTLIPSLQVACLYNDRGVFSKAAGLGQADIDAHPLLKQAAALDVEIGPGDALFIPVGWWHCVTSLDASISVSFTDFHANNQFSLDFPR